MRSVRDYRTALDRIPGCPRSTPREVRAGAATGRAGTRLPSDGPLAPSRCDFVAIAGHDAARARTQGEVVRPSRRGALRQSRNVRTHDARARASTSPFEGAAHSFEGTRIPFGGCAHAVHEFRAEAATTTRDDVAPSTANQNVTVTVIVST